MWKGWQSCALVCALLGTLAPSVVFGASKKDRDLLASQGVGLNFALLEAQRAGKRAKDSAKLFPTIAEWKTPGYTNACTTFVSSLDPEDAAKVDMPNRLGFFEAGTAVTCLGPTAFAATQEAIGAMEFLPQMAKMKAKNALGDPAGCLKGGFVEKNLKFLYLRHMRYMGNSIANSIVKYRKDNSDFAMLVGVADSYTYDGRGLTSWQAPKEWQDTCYIADMDHPAADIAAQAAAALAMMSKVAQVHGTRWEKTLAKKEWLPKAKAAYNYSKKMRRQHGKQATCHLSEANDNCIGTGCETIDTNGNPVLTTCDLYRNTKGPDQQVLVAAAALWSVTKQPGYRRDADLLFDYGLNSFLYNWNNVLTQAILILADAPDLAAAKNSKKFYQGALRGATTNWGNCSNTGVGINPGDDDPFCLRTEDGSAYPLAFPWGNLGTSLNAVCAAGLYNVWGFDESNKKQMKDARCFMHRQLGYIFNHKCTTKGSSCNVPGADGFSYMVGVGLKYPTKIHSRDAGYPNFTTEDELDGSTLCGGIVSGPYAPGDGPDGPVDEGTDLYTNDRRKWRESEVAVDYTASSICALMSYATLPEDAFDHCKGVRSPFTGRKLPVA